MNRDIKFRAWNKDQCRMWMDVQTAYDYMAGPDDANNGESIPATTFGEILRLEDEWIPMQFTGLHDKNGVEIYEGDIIDFDRREWGGDDNIHKVSWDAQEGAWSWGGGSSSDMEWRTVIGNVFENPDLLTTKPHNPEIEQ